MYSPGFNACVFQVIEVWSELILVLLRQSPQPFLQNLSLGMVHMPGVVENRTQHTVEQRLLFRHFVENGDYHTLLCALGVGLLAGGGYFPEIRNRLLELPRLIQGKRQKFLLLDSVGAQVERRLQP